MRREITHVRVRSRRYGLRGCTTALAPVRAMAHRRVRGDSSRGRRQVTPRTSENRRLPARTPPSRSTRELPPPPSARALVVPDRAPHVFQRRRCAAANRRGRRKRRRYRELRHGGSRRQARMMAAPGQPVIIAAIVTHFRSPNRPRACSGIPQQLRVVFPRRRALRWHSRLTLP